MDNNPPLLPAEGTQYYTYDSNGNITQVRTSQHGQVLSRYTYDDLGQLVREDNCEKSRSYYYGYDGTDNILYKEVYNYTLGSLEGVTPVFIYNYYYTDSFWGDLLTSYRRHTITYAPIGNPLSYYGRTSYTFTWEKGRQLATANTGGYSLFFEYNDEGIRTSKTVGDVKHEYIL